MPKGILPSSTGSNERADIRTYIRSLREGWGASKKTKEHAKKRVDEVLKAPDDQRTLLRAVELVGAMERDDLDRFIKLTTLERLIAGESTENVNHTVKVLKGVSMDDL